MTEGPVLRFGRVTNVDDIHGAWRIQVRSPYDNIIDKDEFLPFYIPLLPKMVHIIPKVGELVLLFSMAPGKNDSFGYYLGPIISQEDKLFFEDSNDALSVTDTAIKGWDENPRYKKNILPILYPAQDDITIEGRRDTGIQLKEEEVRIKAGVKVVGDNGPRNNTKNPSFISLKYYPKNNPDRDGFMSTATIVADKINLIGTSSKDSETKDIPVTRSDDAYENEKDNLISDSAMRSLLEKAHRLPYGDTLVDFLNLFRETFEKHVHPFPTMAPCNDENMKALESYDLDGILSDTVRIN